jgi:D-3-phosphoglycerate dehydrogenase / 2-oxoglutarate reductase
MTHRILVTCPPMLGMMDFFHPLIRDRNGEAYCPDVIQTLSIMELVELVPKFDGWIIGDDPATAEVFEAGRAGNLRAAVKWGIGVDNVDFSACERLGIPIANTPDMFGAEVADVALGYVIGLSRDTYLIDRGVRNGNWPKPRGISLKGRRAGVIGYGDIGRHTVERLQAIGMDVVTWDPAFMGDTTVPVPVLCWPDGIEHCDVLVFTCALTPSSYRMLNGDTLTRTKRGVRVVNVARGPLIDEAALVEALGSGQVNSAALDVMEEEPLPADSSLRAFERCIFGSHNGSNTVEAVVATSRLAIDKLFTFLAER